ncbi:MAG: hypothetical protein FJ108_16165 [Deltaproteobacteria bacterium]|nr:hypothetical protein [Deltaproteobacteria bacterium]
MLVPGHELRGRGLRDRDLRRQPLGLLRRRSDPRTRRPRRGSRHRDQDRRRRLADVREHGPLDQRLCDAEQLAAVRDREPAHELRSAARRG